ncbi:MAG: hypothetical protein DME98_01435 [Verrucomicrobia bacterium]|nr:MAG: hypothetical protein DME98_01435 [Verrucomicrobiota bacterium]PYJ31639.1 MAG: hypothetical protein DME88_14065 [Verrucomicrobiota bacterium]
MPFDALRFLLPGFFVLFVLGIFNPTCPANAQSQSGQARTTPARQYPDAKRGLNFSVGAHGLDSLSFNGQSLLVSPESGELQPQKSVFRVVLDALLPRSSSPSATPNKKTDAVDLSYPWGRISCAYGKQDDRLTMRLEVSNTSSEPLGEFSLRLMELNFPRVPEGGTLEAGMFGYGFKGPEWPLDLWLLSIPSVADPLYSVPIIRADFGTGALNFCSDDLECSVGIPHTTNPPLGTRYPLVITCRDVKPGTTKVFNVSLRFGPADAGVQDLSGDVLELYAGKYPFQVDWKDRRPIGAIFLAGPQINLASNPRRWTMNFGEIDITNDKGKAAFRAALLKVADNSVQVLKDIGAQGMITWDPEGEEFIGDCYYGDPRLVPTLAPEMEFKNDGAKSAIDEYFERFRAAGLKVGVCVRPQQIAMVDGKPVHQAAEDEHAVQILRERIAYAKQRWGCTLFYVDSTTTAYTWINPDVFKAVADAYPDVLLIPENESMRYFAYSAPLNSYVHHKITSTPVGARLVYPKAFSVLMAPEGDRPEDHDALVSAVRRGDILLFNGWYMSNEAGKIKKLYQEANPKQTVGP